MAKKYSINAIFVAKDNMTASFRKMRKSSDSFGKAVKKDFAKAQRSVMNFSKNFEKNLNRKLKRGFQVFVLSLVAGLGIATAEFIKLDEAITSASAKFGSDFQRGTVGFDQLTDSARQLSRETEHSVSSVAKGYDVLALAGFEASQAMAMMPSIANLSTAAATDLSEAASMAADSLGAFGLRTPEIMADTALLSENLTRVIDAMAKTATTSNTDLSMLFEAIQKGAPVMSIAGQSVETFTAAAGALANMGIKGSEAGTALRNAMLRLANPSAGAADMMNKLGINIKDSNGDFRDLLDILGDFESSLKETGSAETLGIISEIFGTRVATSMSNMLNIGETVMKDYREVIEDAAGSTEEMADTMRDSFGAKLKKLKNNMLDFGIAIVQAFSSDARDAIESLTDSIQRIIEFDMDSIIASLKNMFEWVKAFIKVMKVVAPFIIAAVVAFKLYRTAMIMAAMAQQMFNVSVSANPIGLVIIAIAALVGLAVVLVRHWDKVSAFFKALWEGIKKGASIAWNGILTGLKFMLNHALAFISTWADGVLTIFGTLAKGVLGGISGILGFLGFDTEGIDGMISRIESLQDSVRDKSLIGGSSLLSYGETTMPTPISPSERGAIITNENVSRGEITIKDETNRAEVNKPITSTGFAVRVEPSGAL